MSKFSDMQYDIHRLKTALHALKATHKNALVTVSERTGISVPTVFRIVNHGRGDAENVDRVARVLGFKKGARELEVPELSQSA